ncbi:KGG domain-containing protein [Frateuria defendens]|uniref:KGG domain-containing protein n=1 Tax=Frateuria defendens TaxID=2219559 RepID=UPI00066FD45E|nr:KGG domain-containing protein [Frateuria defendens]
MANERDKRGFGAMDENKQREAAAKGGRVSHGGQGKEGKEGAAKSAGSRGGSHEQHVRAGQQSHKNS